METLYEKLTSYRDSDYYGFHMPGHKRSRELTKTDLPYGIDITEITGFDDLHHAKGILKYAQERAAKVYHAEESHFLINGSTVGILSSILGVTQKGDKILMARNCHKSVYHAVFLNELKAEYLYPEYDEEQELNGPVNPDDVRRLLEADKNSCQCTEKESGLQEQICTRQRDGRIRAVVIVSPTYDGVLSDVGRIAQIVHEYGIPLIVDEAHGAHFGFHPYFPKNANTKGADIVIHSVHKTLPSLTQTALLHINGSIVDRSAVQMYLHMLQSSSPSYVLMASIDECIRLLDEEGEKIFQTYAERLKSARNRLKTMKSLHLAETKAYDPSKIIISVKDVPISGNELQKILSERYHLEMEFAAGSYVLAMTAVGDTEEGLERLVSALLETDKGLWEKSKYLKDKRTSKTAERTAAGSGRFRLPCLEQVYTSAEMYQLCRRTEQEGNRMTRSLSYEECQGKISLEQAYLYPPGIPMIVSGERISEEAVTLLQLYHAAGFDIEGLSQQGKIKVLTER